MLVIVSLVAFVVIFKPHVEFNITNNENRSEFSSEEDCDCLVESVDEQSVIKPVTNNNKLH